MKYSRTAIGLLTAQYRSVLKKCLLINLGLYALGAVSATPANATEQVVKTVGTVTVNNLATTNGTDAVTGYVGTVSSVNNTTNETVEVYTKNETDTLFATKGVATTSANGLMSSADKTKLDGISEGAEVNTIEGIQLNGT